MLWLLFHLASRFTSSNLSGSFVLSVSGRNMTSDAVASDVTPNVRAGRYFQMCACAIKSRFQKIYKKLLSCFSTSSLPANGATRPPSLDIMLELPTARWRTGVGKSSAVKTYIRLNATTIADRPNIVKVVTSQEYSRNKSIMLILLILSTAQ